MVSYAQIIQRLPQEWQMTMVELVEAVEEQLRKQLAVRREDFERLSATVGQLVQAQARTEAQVRALTEAQARTEAQVRALTEAQARTEAQVRALAEAQARTEAEFREYREASEARFARIEAALDRLTEAQARTEQTLQALIAAHQKLETRVGRMDGELLEIRYERRATAYFGRVLRRVRVVEVPELLDTLEARLTPEEVDDLLNLDLLVVGRPRRTEAVPETEVWLAVEVSAVVDTEDVERALERATLLRKAGYFAIPTVAGREATSVAESAAQQQGVLLFRDGRSDYWEEALARWRE